MSEWIECKLGELLDKVIDNRGKNPPYTDNGYEVIETSSISGDTKFPDYAAVKKYVNEETYKNWFRGHPKAGDILIITVGNGIGSVSLMQFDRGVITQNLIGLRFLCETAVSSFYYYFLNQSNIQDFLKSLNIGSAQPSLKVPHLLGINVPLPPLPEQKAIANVLSSLDDKIDLLHRQNKTLEAMAETLFRQWFIEEAKEDWEEKPLSFFGEIICGKTPSKSERRYFIGDIPFIKIPDLHGMTFVYKTEDSLSYEGMLSQPKKTIPRGSICVSCIATVGLVSMTITDSQTNQQINSIIPSEEKYRYYIYLVMKNSYDLLQALASGGTATLNLNTGNFSKILVVLPDINTLSAFHGLVEPLFNKVFSNQSQIQTLEKLRDNLLPKLMSGEVRVAYDQQAAA